MFATLLGALPRPTVDAEGRPIARAEDPDADVIDELIAVVVRAQEVAGLEPVTDGRLGDPELGRIGAVLAQPNGTERAVAAALEAWHRTAAAATHAAKQALPGPYSIGIRSDTDRKRRAARTLAAAEALAEVVAALADAGCPLVEIEESAVGGVGGDEDLRLFADAHRRLTAAGKASAMHRSLSITGGALPTAAIGPVVELPYASLAVDLIAGPDNWYLVRRAAGEQGVVAGVLSGGEVDEAKEVMVWGAHYAASSSGRGRHRVGLGSAGSWANLTWEAAQRKLGRLGDAARLSAMPLGEDLARSLDPRAVSAKRAAMGHPPDPRFPEREDRRET
jgi:hypothetical protein